MTPLRVALLWHQHQPLYRSPASGRYALPWVRLHGLKDYYDMAALALEHPRLRLTINLVPSLLDQIEEYASGSAEDPALTLARRPAADLDEDERLALLDLFFSVPYPTLIAPFRRYAALFHKRGARGPDGRYRDALERFQPDDLRDLQVWFHLAWSGRALRQRPEARDLFRKGERFTEPEKLALLAAQQELLREIVPIHARLRDAGIAELSTSPAYHPILPLLCDLDSAREAIPSLPLPSVPFRHPEDAAWHIREGLRTARARFGASLTGMWPSEGSLSVEALRLMGEAGVTWTASDEDVLRASAGRGLSWAEVHRAWRVAAAGDRCPAIFFRDKALSDLIGFSYAAWKPEIAAADFIGRLRGRAAEAPGGVVSVILDGENAWEHYPGNGVEFLHALYDGLSSTDGIEPVTFSQALAGGGEAGRLERLRAGSWIGASFTTWIGHPEKNRAWSMLAAARQEAERALGGALAGSPAWSALAAAEGSDWFWWLGEDHSSEQDAIFDASFRDLLRIVYATLGVAAPAGLDEPIKRTQIRRWTPPTASISPTLDGRVSDFFEWMGAGLCDAAAGQGAMHRGQGMVRRVAFGTDGSALFVRVDPDHGSIAGMLSSIEAGILTVAMVAPRRVSLALTVRGGSLMPLHETAGGIDWAAGSVLEARLPLEGTDPCDLFVSVESAGGALQRLPGDGFIRVVPDQPEDWSV